VPVVSTSFGIRYNSFNRLLLGLLGMGPGQSSVVVGDRVVDVTMGWAFRTSFERSVIESVEADDDRVWGWGVHGWRDRWLVNGSSDGLVRITLGEPVDARICFVPWRARVLRVSVDDRDALIAALTAV
jgi:hypothetical protein